MSTPTFGLYYLVQQGLQVCPTCCGFKQVTQNGERIDCTTCNATGTVPFQQDVLNKQQKLETVRHVLTGLLANPDNTVLEAAAENYQQWRDQQIEKAFDFADVVDERLKKFSEVHKDE